MPEEPRHRSFRAMGTTIELTLWGVDAGRADTAARELALRAERWEQIFSRFRDDSELSRINRAGGAWMKVSSELAAVVALAQEWFVASGGRFDPTILASLERAGYDRPFAAIGTSGTIERPDFPFESSSSRDVLAIALDQRAGAIRLPVGMRIDLGGIAKGAFVDSVEDLFVDFPGAIVDAGGDLRVWGQPGNEVIWRIGVQHPGVLDADIAELQLWAGRPLAVATSSTRSRTWLAGNERQNHLIDPRTGRAVHASTPSVTVVANTVVTAEILAKSILIASSRGEELPQAAADLVLIAFEDGRYETIAPYAAAA